MSEEDKEIEELQAEPKPLEVKLVKEKDEIPEEDLDYIMYQPTKKEIEESEDGW